MGNLNIRADYKARGLAHGVAVRGSDRNDKSVTVLGNTHVELVGC
jgi:hypothetical protein